jgi:hypothetical protein
VTAAPRLSDLLAQREWLMTPGERAALAGVVSLLEPDLSVEIGTFTGRSLEVISAHSRAVHAFDLRRHASVTDERFPNVTFHIGSSHELLPLVLAELAESSKTIDFALVDGDHSAQGVKQDLEDLLASPAVSRTVILLHDTLNARVRAGLEGVDYDGNEKISYVDLDFVQGRVMADGPQKDELWYGLGLVVVGWDLGDDADWPQPYPAPDVYGAFSEARPGAGKASERLGYTQLLDVERDLAVERDVVRLMQSSLSWRMTAPLRRAHDAARRAKARLR